MSDQKVALVTGAGKRTGIGFEVCRQLASAGFKVWLSARNADSAAALATELARDGLAVESIQLDINDEASVQRAVSSLHQLDVLVNNAAEIGPYGELAAAADLEIAHRVLETTLFGSWRMAKAFLPLLRKSPSGRLVNVSSGAGSHGDTMFGLTTGNSMGTSYAVAKAALNALTVKLAREEPAGGVLINAVCPGFTSTFEGGESMGARPVADGAKSVVWAALLPNDGPTGGLFRDGQPLPW